MYMHVGYFYNMHVFCAVMLKYGLLTKCEVKMAGYSPGSFFACLWTEQAWSIKDLLYGFWWNFACRIQQVVPSGQDGSILPAQVANLVHLARLRS